MLTKSTCPLGFLPLDAFYTTLPGASPGVSFPETTSQGRHPAAHEQGADAQGGSGNRSTREANAATLPHRRGQRSLKMLLILTRHTSQEPNFRASCNSLVVHVYFGALIVPWGILPQCSLQTWNHPRNARTFRRIHKPSFTCSAGQSPSEFWLPLLSIFTGSQQTQAHLRIYDVCTRVIAKKCFLTKRGRNKT